jgi:hypothetical protein
MIHLSRATLHAVLNKGEAVKELPLFGKLYEHFISTF